MATQRIGYEQLAGLSGIEGPAAVCDWLQHEGVSYSLDANALPWTTLSAIERAARRRLEQGRYPYADAVQEF